MKSVLVAAAAALVVGSAALAQGPPQAAKTKAAAKPAEKNVVCVAEQDLSSRISKRRVCLTKEQWKEKHREQREFAEDIQSGAWGAQSDPASEANRGPSGGPTPQ